jgi:hypothetical protein
MWWNVMHIGKQRCRLHSELFGTGLDQILTYFITTLFNYNSSERVIHECVIHCLIEVYCDIDIKIFFIRSCILGNAIIFTFSGWKI